MKSEIALYRDIVIYTFQYDLLDPVALLHALVTWFRILCCLEILVISITFLFQIQVTVPTASGS